MSIAAGAAQLGARAVLIEADKMGGDCLNTGCVPSKSLIAAAKAATAARNAHRFGVEVGNLRIDFAKAQGYVNSVIGAIAPHDSVERFTKLGCTVLGGHARFLDSETVEVDGKKVSARRFAIATGSRALIPPIPGLADIPFFTNESIFENSVLPARLVVIGAGPVGCEMAQAHRRLGAEVTLLDIGRMLPRDDREAVDVVRQRLRAEGVEAAEYVNIVCSERTDSGIAVVAEQDRAQRRIEGSHVLVAAGRRPNVDDLGLEAAGVRYSAKGIEVDARLRTTNKRIFAAGDVIGGNQFTHMASYHAGIVIRNALFRLPAKAAPKAFPWVTYTDPELAQVGLTEEEARHSIHDIRVLHADFSDIDRALTEGAIEGFLKVILSKRGRVLGATIVGANAGELILPWTLAISQGLGIRALAEMIVPYPTLSEITKRAAGSYYTPSLFSERTRKLVRVLGIFG